MTDIFQLLQDFTCRPEPFSTYNARELWDDPHIAQQMLQFHLDGAVDISSRKAAFIDRSAQWIREYFNLHQGRQVLDLGCGPGLYASRLAATGAVVTGVDFSENSIHYARKQAEENGQDIRYLHASYLDPQLPELTGDGFDLAILIMCDYCALSPQQRQTLLGNIQRGLRKGGALLFDVYSHAAFGERQEVVEYAPDLMGGFWSAQPYHGFQQTFLYSDEKVALDKYLIVESGRTRTCCNWLAYFSVDMLSDELSQAGFTMEKRLGNVAGDDFDPEASEFAVVARAK